MVESYIKLLSDLFSSGSCLRAVRRVQSFQHQSVIYSYSAKSACTHSVPPKHTFDSKTDENRLFSKRDLTQMTRDQSERKETLAKNLDIKVDRGSR